MLTRSSLAIAICFVLTASANADITLDYLTNANSLSATPGPAAFSVFGMGNFATLTQSDVTLTVNAMGGDQSNTSSGLPEPIGVNGANPVGSNYGDGDGANFGIGVRGNGSWAIRGNSNEVLSLSFSQAVMLNSIDLNGVGSFGNNANNDRARVIVDAFDFVVFDNQITSGTAPVGTTFSGGGTDVVSFATPLTLAAGQTIQLRGFNAGNGNFSLRGLNVTIPTAIPEPSSFAILTLAACGLSVRRRK